MSGEGKPEPVGDDGEFVIEVGLPVARPVAGGSVEVSVEEDGNSPQAPQSDGDVGMPEAEDPYSVDDAGPMSKTQRIVLVVVAALLVVGAAYIMHYWGLF